MGFDRGMRLSKPSIGEGEKREVSRVLGEEFLGCGVEVKGFEEDLGEYFGGRGVVCVNSGTAALQLAVQAIGGGEILVPSLTFVACFQAIKAGGGEPVACEVNLESGLMDLEDVRRRVTAKTKGIMPVHYTGMMCDMGAIWEFAKQKGLRVIEDAAHAIGGRYKDGSKVGSVGDIVCFSFDGIKNITSGEGGAVVSGDLEVIRKVRDSRLLGIEKDTEARYRRERLWEFEVREAGYRYHMSDINAAIGRVQLRRLDGEFGPKRVKLWKRYRELFEGVDGVRVLEGAVEGVVPHIMVIRVFGGRRDEVRERLKEEGIGVGMHYKPSHLLERFKTEYKLPNVERLYGELLTLPLHVDLEVEDVERVVGLVREGLRG